MTAVFGVTKINLFMVVKLGLRCSERKANLTPIQVSSSAVRKKLST